MVAEVQPGRSGGLDPRQRVPPGGHVAGLAVRQILSGRAQVEPGGVRGVAGEEVSGAVAGAHHDHLLAGAPQKSDFKDLQSLFAKTGDTQKLPVLDLNLAS